MTSCASEPEAAFACTLPDPRPSAASWGRSPGPMKSMLEAVMCCAKRDAQGTYTYAKWEDVNFKLDSPQSESDRGESQLKIERAKWWLHISLPGPSMFEKGYILIRIYCSFLPLYCWKKGLSRCGGECGHVNAGVS